MEEKKKKEASTAIIMVTIVLVAIVSSILSIVIYKQMLNNSGEKHLVSSLQEDLEKVQSENTVNGTNNENNGSNISENTEQTAKVNLPLTINNKNINLEIEASFVNWEMEEEALFNQKTVIKINGKVCDEINTTTWTQVNTLNYEIPEVKFISDSSSEEEYIVLIMNESTPSSNTEIIRIYDDEGNVITEFDNLGKTEVIVSEDNYTIPVYEIYSDRIIICEALSDGGARLHEYTIDNGELKDEITREYSEDEVEQAGATA